MSQQYPTSVAIATKFLHKKLASALGRHSAKDGVLFKKVEDWPYVLLTTNDLEYLKYVLGVHGEQDDQNDGVDHVDETDQEILKNVIDLLKDRVAVMKDQGLCLVLHQGTADGSHTIVFDALPAVQPTRSPL